LSQYFITQQQECILTCQDSSPCH